MKNFPKEDLLHYVWRTKRFDFSNLSTTSGEPIEVLSFGFYNENAGPDFLEAQLNINNQLWAGHVEMHVKSSDWLRHGHETDLNYDNVILHVVYLHDKDIKRMDGSIIPCIELKDLISPAILSKYKLFESRDHWVVCQNFISQIDSITMLQAKQNALVQKLSRRSENLSVRLNELNGDWISLIQEQLFRSFGLKINAEAFLSLARAVPYQILQRNKEHLIQIEALLFGVAGMIPESSDDKYVQLLINEFKFLQNKYQLATLNPVIWKFSKLRPAGFPTIRLAQLARIINQIARLDVLLFDSDIQEIKDGISVQIKEGYWFDHYVFNKASGKKVKTIGDDKLDVIVINAVAPLLFLYGKKHDSQLYIDKALAILESLKPEKNSIINKWSQLGMHALNAADSQGLLELKQKSCDNFKCLSCPIGHQIISR